MITPTNPPSPSVGHGSRRTTKGARRGWRHARPNALDQFKYICRNFLYNTPGRLMFRSHSPALSQAQQKVASELAARGIALIHFNELFGDTNLWNGLQRNSETFVKSEMVAEGIRQYKADTSEARKVYLVRAYPENATLALDNPWLRLGLDERILGIANAYLGLWAKLNYADVWYTIPSSDERPATASQRWHRDPEDKRIVKVFLYFSDVDESAGPLQYVPGSSRSRGVYRHVSFKKYRAPEHEFEARFPPSLWATCTGAAGTFVFCDTTGFHRGGYATGRPRTLSTWTYVTPASLTPCRFKLDGSPDRSQLGKLARYALS